MKSIKIILILAFITFSFVLLKGFVHSQTDPPDIPLEGDPRCIAINPFTNQAVVANTKPNEVCIVDLASQTVITTIPVGKRPLGVAIDSDLNYALASSRHDHTLSVINLNTYQVIAKIPVGKSPEGIAVNELNGVPHIALVVNNQDDSVSVVDLGTLSVIRTIDVGRRPKDVAIDSDLNLALVVNEKDQNVSVIDLNTYEVTGSVPVGRKPRAISLNPETHLAVVTDSKDDSITIINLQNWQTTPLYVEDHPIDVAVNPLDNRALVLCDRDKLLVLVDLNTNTVIESYSLNKKSRGVAVNDFTNIAAVIDDKTDSLTLYQLPNPVPVITSINPEIVLRGSNATKVMIEGAGFIKTSTVSTLPVTFIDNHYLEVEVPESLLSGTGIYEIVVTNPTPNGGSSNPLTLYINNPLPTLTSLNPESTMVGTPGLTLTVNGTGFFNDTIVSINGIPRGFTLIDQRKIQIQLTAEDLEVGKYLDITAYNPLPGGGQSNVLRFMVLNPVPALSSIDPSSMIAGSPDFTLTLNGNNFVKTTIVSFNGQPVVSTYISKTQLQATIPSSAITTSGNYPVKVINPAPGGGETSTLTFTVESPIPPVEPQPEGSFGEQYQDLIPPDVTIQSYDPKRFSLITGLVKNLGGSPIANVSVNILGRMEYGTATTNTEGRFTIPVEGGGPLTVTYKKDGLITTHRKVYVPWNDIAIAETIVMIPEDTRSTTLTFDGNPNTIVSHQSTIVTDDRGSRSSTIVSTGDNRAYSIDASGNVIQELTSITTRATEFATENSMPAKLPPNSAYTYCVELSVDGAQRVRFDKPVVLWVDNFLGFNVGEAVPVGYYDRDRGVWVPSDNGRVVRLLDTNGDGIVDALDANGDGQPDDLNSNGSFSDEVLGLNDTQRYTTGSTYWRVEVTHLSPWDCNWPYGPPADAIPPNPVGNPEADQQKNEEDDCKKSGSIIEVRSRILHEDIPIPGTDMTLHYASNRTKGFQQKITVSASGPTVPASLKSITVKLGVAGRIFEQTLDPLPNQKAEFIWDGLNYLGKPMIGSTTTNISVGFVYDAVYLSAGNFAQAFAQAGSQVTGIRARQELISWKQSKLDVVPYNEIIEYGKGSLAEGWTFSPHHNLNQTDINVLYKGNGGIIRNDVRIIDTAAGDKGTGYNGDGIPAKEAHLYYPEGITINAIGNLYIADTSNHRIRKVDTNGIISTVAGNGVSGYGGDGGPATAANLYNPVSIAVDAIGNLYIADASHRIRKVDTNGIITTIAGTGTYGYSGDGGPATAANIYFPSGVQLDNAGNLYFGDSYNRRVRKIDANGIITTVAGNGVRDYSGDGGPATSAKLSYPADIAIDVNGNLYILDWDNHRIRKVDINGIITTVAGTGIAGYSGDGGPAIFAKLNYPYGVAVDVTGNLYITDSFNYRVRKVNSNGIITTIAGTGTFGYGGNGGLATEARIATTWGISIDTAGNLYFRDDNIIRKVAPPYIFTSFTTAGDLIFAEENGMGYVLSSAGRHKSTIDLNTGSTLYSFGYDQNNNLISITDRFGNQTTIQRNTNGVPSAIVSPDGLKTSLTVDSNNHLTRITYPDTNFYSFEYTPDGLMTAKIEPEGNRFEHMFDSIGRLTDAKDQEGGHWQYSRSVYTNGDIQTQVLSAEGNLTTYLDHTDSTGAYTSRITDPSGAETIYTRSADKLTATKALPCGMNLTFKYGVDSQYKFEFVKEMREKAASGLEKITLREKVYQDTDADTIPDLISEKITLNGKLTTFVTNTLQSKKTLTSAVGRTTTTFYDPNNLLATKLTIPGLYDTNFGYDTRGRLTSINTDIRQTTFAYDAQGDLSSITDPENKVTNYSYDAVGRMTGVLRPDSSSVSFTYDKNGNMTILTNPSTINHGFGYNRVNLNSSYQTPLSGSYSYLYNRDRRLTQINFPSGRQIRNIYDKDRLVQTQTPEGNIDLTYVCGSKLNSITKAGEVITYRYDGSLVTSETLSGTLNQVLTYTYNNDLNVKSFTYAGGTVNYTYDDDGLLTGAGNFTITRNVANGLPEAVTGGSLNINRTFNSFGELEGQNFTVNSFPHISWNLTRDKTARITSKMETVEGTASNYVYTYDSMGRLLTVTKDGALIEEYQYDSIGRRTYEMNVPKGISGRAFTYSDEDHLLTAGDVAYQYDTDGFLTTRTEGTNVTEYSYSSRGELLSVTLPDARVIEYVHDPLGRRIAKKIDGVIVEKYLWQGLTRLLAVYDGGDNLVLKFEYADARIPAAVNKAGTTYYLTHDQVGSLRLVSDTSGNVVKRIDYDSFGSIINDTNPAFSIPFGFAGGLHDRDAGIVRFGFRDYDSEIGRWTAKDPIKFWRGNVDLYGYVLNNPVNWVDPWGLFMIEVNDTGGRNGQTYGGNITLTGENGSTVTVPGSSWPNPNNPNPGIAEGSYNATFSQTGHHGTEPGVRLENGGNIPTIGPNPAQNNEQFANGINIHCGDTATNRGSAGCITIQPDHCQQVWDVLRQGETGTVNITR